MKTVFLGIYIIGAIAFGIAGWDTGPYRKPAAEGFSRFARAAETAILWPGLAPIFLAVLVDEHAKAQK